MGEQIIKLRAEGKTYNEIMDILGCSKGTVSYHLGVGQKEKTALRALKCRYKKNETAKKHRAFIREFVFRYKKIKGCIDCGINNPIVLDFDHINRSDKVVRISQMVKSSPPISAVKDEIRKCEVRCSNCHRIKTARELNWYCDLISS